MGFRSFGWAVFALVVLAGCGGASAVERGAAGRTWSAAADVRCERSSSFVVSAQQPSTVPGLRPYAKQVVGYTRDGIADIERVPVPKGIEGRAARVSSALRSLEPSLRELEESSRIADRRAQVAAAIALRERWQEIEPALQAAGLRSCSGARQGEIVADAVLAPLWVQEFAELHDEAERRAITVWRGATTPESVPTALRKAARITDRMARRIAALEEPGMIDDTGYLQLLADLAHAERGLAGRIRSRDAGAIRSAQRELRSVLRRTARETARLGIGTGHFAVPIMPKGSLRS
jgi:hypothetical protein